MAEITTTVLRTWTINNAADAMAALGELVSFARARLDPPVYNVAESIQTRIESGEFKLETKVTLVETVDVDGSRSLEAVFS